MVIRSTLTLALGLVLTGTAALAQSDKELSDAERAKRDAAKVFSFIKFQTVRSAAPKPVAAPVAAAPAAPIKSAEAKPAEPEGEAPRLARLGAGAAGAPTELRSDDVQIAVPQQQVGQALAALPTEIVPEEVELELVHYVPPEMNRRVLDAMTKPEYLVPVRFVVTEEGRVATAQAAGTVPRHLGQAAAKAVQQWRFKPLPAAREVDVEIAFKAD